MRDKEPGTDEEMDPWCDDPKERLKVMDGQHVEASLGFPSFPRFCGQAFSEQFPGDRELSLAVVRAYNDWMVKVVRRLAGPLDPADRRAVVGPEAGGG